MYGWQIETLESELQAKDSMIERLKLEIHGIESERAVEVQALIALEHDLEKQGFQPHHDTTPR